MDLDDDNSVANWFETRRGAYRAMQYWIAKWYGLRGLLAHDLSKALTLAGSG